MQYSLEEKYNRIKSEIVNIKSANPIEVVKEMMHRDCIAIHGPEHHFLDGAALLTAYYNAGGNIDLRGCLDALAERSIKMPGGYVRLLGGMRFGGVGRCGVVDYPRHPATLWRRIL